MGKRRKARERAFQLVYMYLMNQEDPAVLCDRFWDDKKDASEIVDFTNKIFMGVERNRQQIEGWISDFAINWELERILTTDRAILMLALYEMFFLDDIPMVVSINEALELAKKYSGDDSYKFVNGILDQARKKLKSKIHPDT